ncbi:MAG: aspartate kinase [Holosporaceae bacterium]|nr:aspartate kinase [Holosporaceae bacterium]
MSCIVKKFGGTSVATLERIKNVANIIADSLGKKHTVVAVVSAMAGVTNKFVNYINNLDTYEGDPEYDCVVSSGELVTSGLLAIALKNLGINAKSYASWQVPIFTDNNHGRAIIQKIDPVNLQSDISCGIVPVICGFQGVSPDNRVTTLGRGGSDLTAVAISSAINADLCEIYSDVDGVYTVDPNLYPEAKKIEEVSFCEMLEMASYGAKVLQEQSVDYAMNKNVTIRVASSFIDNGGTIISKNIPMKHFRGLAITHNLSQMKISYGSDSNLKDIIALLKKNFIRVEILHDKGSNKTIFMIDRKKAMVALKILRDSGLTPFAKQEFPKKHFSQISVIGSSFSESVCKKLSNALEDEKINVFSCSIFDYRINVIIPSDQLLNAIRVLHQYCELDK